jgi:hypothetical protein
MGAIAHLENEKVRVVREIPLPNPNAHYCIIKRGMHLHPLV